MPDFEKLLHLPDHVGLAAVVAAGFILALIGLVYAANRKPPHLAARQMLAKLPPDAKLTGLLKLEEDIHHDGREGELSLYLIYGYLQRLSILEPERAPQLRTGATEAMTKLFVHNPGPLELCVTVEEGAYRVSKTWGGGYEDIGDVQVLFWIKLAGLPRPSVTIAEAYARQVKAAR